jgi:hypothetical protein
MTWRISKHFFLHFLCQKHESIFLWQSLCEAGVALDHKSHITMGAVLWLCPAAVSNSLTFLHWTSSNSITLQGFQSQNWTHSVLLLWFSVSVSCEFFIYICLSTIGSSKLLCVFPFLTDTRTALVVTGVF